MKIFKKLIKVWQSYIDLKKLDITQNSIVFYAEFNSDWIYLEPIALDLQNAEVHVIRLTSDDNDITLEKKNSYFIGSGIIRTIIFKTINAKGFVMTLTDLNSFHLKKSIYPVHYFYLFHSLVSTHRVYRQNSFDAYDTIFCCGNYQIEEIKETEKKYNLKKKNLIKQGYVRLDEIIKEKNQKTNGTKNIIIAPTWGASSLIANNLEKLIDILLFNNYHIVLRLHPMTIRHYPKLSKQIDKCILSTDDSEIAKIASQYGAYVPFIRPKRRN